MSDYEEFKKELFDSEFFYMKDEKTQKDHIGVNVDHKRINLFSEICQKYLNNEFNYVDVQFPVQGETVIIFREKVFFVKNNAENEIVKSWAIHKGLPAEQADWGKSF